MRVAILTVSDAGSRGERADRSGDAIAAWAAAASFVVAERALVPDRSERIAAQLVAWCDGGTVDLVLTAGGTGLSPSDVTPEATRAVLDREAPGIAERLRTLLLDRFPMAALSRGIAGVRGRTLVINLPGSTAGVLDGLAALEPIVRHAVGVMQGGGGEHPAHGGSVPALAEGKRAAEGR